MRTVVAVFLSDFSSTTDALSSTLGTSSSVSNECICGNEILSNATIIKELVVDLSDLRHQISFLNRSIWTWNHSKTTVNVFDDLNEMVMGVVMNMMALNASSLELQQQMSYLNLSIWTLNHSKTAIDQFDDLNETVMGVMTNIMALNDSITDVQRKSGSMQSTMTMLNDSIMTMNSDNMALKATVLQLNDSQLMMDSMFPDWPMAIACNMTDNYDEYFGVYVHYLVVVEEAQEWRGYGGQWPAPLYVYRWVGEGDPSDGTSPQYSDMHFYADGSFYMYRADNKLRSNNCNQKTIQELRDAGLAFNFIVS